MSKFFNELKRRNVIKAAIAYAVVSWVLVQILSIVLPSVDAPEWVMKTIMLLMIIGFPVWVLISWVYEVTPEGLKKTAKVSKDQSISATTNKRLNILILIGLVATITVAMLRPTTTTLIKTDDGQFAIAVLPFDDLTKDGDSEWFCVGVTEDILTHLSKIKDLRVISRTSVMQYKNHEKTIPEIAQELGVSYIVEGSVRSQDDKVLVTAQLINAEDTHLWADNYNENLNDVFKIQQEVSKKIVKQLQLAISPEEEEALSSSSTTNVEAFQLFLKGRTIADSRTKEDLERSITYYEQAIALDPNYADAYAEIANSTNLLIGYGNMPRDEYTAKSRDYIKKALAINPNTVRAYSVLGNIFTGEQKWDLSKENFEKALSINPNDATTHHHYAIYYRNKIILYIKEEEDNKKFLYHINKAQQLDPLSSPINTVKVQALMLNSKFDEAEIHLNKMGYLMPSSEAINLRAQINVLKNKDATAYISVYKAAVEKEPNNASLHGDLGYFYRAILNDYKNSLKHVKKAFELDATYRGSYIYSLVIAKQYDEAEEILKDSKLINSLSESQIVHSWYAYYAWKRDYKNARHYLEQYKAHDSTDYFSENRWLLSLIGDKDTVLEMLNTQNEEISDRNKVTYFANLKMKDSMYYYMDKINSNDNRITRILQLMRFNGRFEFDPYRNEPRFKALLKANYIPVLED